MNHKLPAIIVFICLLCAIFASNYEGLSSTIGAASASNINVLTYDLDYSNVPDLYFDEVTLIVTVGDAANISVAAGATPISSTYNSADGTVYFSTSANQVTVTFESLAPNNDIGDVQKAALKNDKGWAWSHGFDDNVNLKPAVEAFKAKGWPATIFAIARYFEQTRDEYWILDEPYFNNTLLVDGWALGNHSWDHERFDNDPPTMQDYTDDILDGQTHFEATISRSTQTDFQVMVFANPNFSSGYDIPFEQASQTTALKLQETGGDSMLVVDGTSDYSASGETAKHMVGRTKIGRDISIETNVQDAIAAIDWMAQNHASSGRHFWFNTLAHGNHEIAITTLINHIWNNYGPAGTNEAWVATSTEIYSYLLVRDNVVVTLSGSSESTSTPTATAVHTNTPTATATQTQTPTLPPTQTVAPTATQTAIPTGSATSIPTETPTAIHTLTAVPSPTATSPSNPLQTPTFTPVATVVASPTGTIVASPTATVLPTVTGVPTLSGTPTATAVPTTAPNNRLQFIFLPLLHKPRN